MRIGVFLFFIHLLTLYIQTNASARSRVEIIAEDGLKITADAYIVNDSLPWMLLFHQGASSRGEYLEIAPKLNRIGFNCLVVDLRFGREINFVHNETAEAAATGDYSRNMSDAMTDIKAAFDWVAERTSKGIILFGSSFSASLAMIYSVENPGVKAVIAFSPGEFFGHPDLVQNAVADLRVPLFLASTNREFPYVTELSSGIGNRYKTIFTPAGSGGTHGARALWEDSEGSREYWLAMIMFLNRFTAN